MPREAILNIVDILTDDLEPKTMRSHSVPASLQVLTALRYYATGSFQQVVGDLVGLSQPTISRIVSRTSRALAAKVADFIKFPLSPREQLAVKQGFSSEFNMPNTVGFVDGTLIAIKRPTEREDAYVHVCRKMFHALNVQGVCDNKKRLTNLVVKWPGCPHDAHIWNNCELMNYMENHHNIGHLLGDSAYPLRQYLLTLLRNPVTPGERAFNSAQKRARQRIEDTFGRWKSRWMCIHKYGGPLTVNLETAIDVIVSTGILHNICEDLGIPVDLLDPEEQENEDENDDTQDIDGRHLRNRLIAERF
ncbi:HARBI1 [Mytilus coruscus]|uniref:Putative nuclease HARBI1 n=1 Tax=Mytilus coruscus TaxID=42192 RepID=A0A6J8ER59_MYTCO|nr:HARBI1 [Mytilus coruscus]